jgi:restriction system protein
VTQASRDDGVDGVAVNEDPIMGGVCVIQAKRYSGMVPVEAVRALAGVMDDKRANRGVLVTTSWFGKATHDFAARHGRIQLIEGSELKHLLAERLKLDVVIGQLKGRTGR